MSIGSISFWQQDQSFWNQSDSFYSQDQNYWSQQQNEAQATAAETALVSVMSTAETSKETGLSSIANKEALTRVNNQIAADEKALAASSGSSTSSGSSASSASSSPYATAIGTVPLTTSTPLSTLGIPPNGTITVSDGTHTTLYASTGTDTVGNLISVINANVAGNAYVTASLNSSGKLTFTAKNTNSTVTVGGVFASDVGFGNGNTVFKPNPKAANSSTVSSAASPSSASLSRSSTSTAKSTAGIVSASSLNASSAESLLSQSGLTGTLVNLLA